MRKLIHNKPAFVLMCVLMGVASSFLWASITDWNVHSRPNADWFSGNNTYRDVPMQWIREMDTLVGSGIGIHQGTAYYVDKASGSSINSGLSWSQAMDTIAGAITLSNTNTSVTGNTTNMNRIYIQGGTYTEDLDIFPKNCHVIGVGTLTRIQNLGTHTCAGVDNCHFWNISFRGGTASAAMISIANSSHTLGFHGCIFDSQATISSVLYYAGSSSNQIIENCDFGFETSVANSPDIAIHLYGVHCQRMKIVNNRIWSTGTGIQIENMASSNFLLIKDNVLAVGPGSADDQMAIGIYDKTSSPRGALYVNNYISAVDALKFDAANSKAQWISMGNWVNQGTTPAWEDGGTID